MTYPIVEESATPETIKCPFCLTDCTEGNNYCHECSGELKEADQEKLLGVEITTEDIKDYVISGRVHKNVKVGSVVDIGICTLTSGEWKTANHAAEMQMAAAGQQISFTIELHQRIAAYGIRAINGISKVGEFSNEKRYEYIQSLSSDMVEIIASKVKILHKIMMKKIQEGQVANF